MSETIAEPTTEQIETANKILKALETATLVTASIPVMHPVTGKPKRYEDYRSEFVQGAYDPVENSEEVCIAFEGDEQVCVGDLYEATEIQGNSFKIGDRTFKLFHETVAEVSIAEPDKLGFVLIQKGGTDSELYVHAHDSLEAAKADRVSCATDGAYETSPIVEVPAHLANAPGFYDTVEEIVRAATDMDQPESEEEA